MPFLLKIKKNVIKPDSGKGINVINVIKKPPIQGGRTPIFFPDTIHRDVD